MRTKLLSILVSLLPGLGVVHAEAAEQQWYLAPSLSHVIADDDRGADNGWGGSLALGRQLDEAWNLEFSLLGDSLGLDGRPGDWRQWGVAVDGLYFLGREKAFAPYLVMGAGYLHSRIPGDGDGGLMAAAGVGFQRQLADAVSLRGDLRYRWSQADLATIGDDAFGDWVVSFGLNIALGGKAPAARPVTAATAEPAPVAPAIATPEAAPVSAAPAPAAPAAAEVVRLADGDRDGVPDTSDRCPDTPAGAPVDAQGCEPDADKDGVVDRLDRCPDTPAGAPVDAQGCEPDADKDGVVDRLDRCPDTLAGAPVDAQGCEPDADKDGVVDRLDRCPDTPAGASVDAQGCEPDADKDGVVDRLDRCPDTPAGASVDAQGCEPDADKDGVVDRLDRCPDTPAGASVDAQGCEPDADKDGVVDRLDRCPDTPAGAPVDAQGCEPDADKDGVLDRLDRCPDTPAGAPVDAQGCEPDSDRDGVVDRVDRCPDTRPGAPVDAQGCEPDSDRDGVVDRRDRCPDTPPGTAVDGMGCTPPAEIAALKAEPARQLVQAGDGDVVVLLKGVNFEFDSAALRPDAVAILDQAVSVLKYRSDIVKVEIAGHTCRIGTERYNQGLSERRANSVYRYFVGKGLAGERFVVTGYGELKPAFSNDTRAGRASNRRVELHIVTD